MARTYTRPAQENDFLDGFTDQQTTLEQIYLFQVKTNSYMLDDALYGFAQEGRPAEFIALTLEGFENISMYPDDEVFKKADELALRFRKEYNLVDN